MTEIIGLVAIALGAVILVQFLPFWLAMIVAIVAGLTILAFRRHAV